MLLNEKKEVNTTVALIEYLLVAFFALACIMSNRFIFGNKFFYDSNFIREIMAGGAVADKTYTATANTYLAFGFTSNTSNAFESVFAAFFFLIVTWMIIRKNAFLMQNIEFVVMMIIWSIAYAAYLSVMGKDQIAFFFIGFFPLLMTLIFDKKSQYIYFFVFGIFLYAFFYRSYWFLIIALAIITNGVSLIGQSRIKKIILICFTAFLFMLSLFVAYRMIYGTSLMSVRTYTNMYRLGSTDAKSMIVNISSSNTLSADALNYIYSILVLLFPISISGGTQLAYYLWIWVVIINIVTAICKFPISQRRSYRSNLPILLLLSFFLIQACFEPDLGSVFRHQSVLFPLISWELIYLKKTASA